MQISEYRSQDGVRWGIFHPIGRDILFAFATRGALLESGQFEQKYWTSVVKCQDVNKSYTKFLEILTVTFNNCCPKRKEKHNGK